MLREHNAGHIAPYHNVMIKFQFSIKKSSTYNLRIHWLHCQQHSRINLRISDIETKYSFYEYQQFTTKITALSNKSMEMIYESCLLFHCDE